MTFQSLIHPHDIGFPRCGLGVEVKTIHLGIVCLFKDQLQHVVGTLAVLQNLEEIDDTVMFYIVLQNLDHMVVPGFHSFDETFESR